MLVATLIATIVFAAAFTLLGGYNQNTGIPFFRSEPSLIFVISDAVSLISSSASILLFFFFWVTSILIFLSMLASSYAELDLLESLPEKLMFGLATLFFSIVSI
ncbi:putative PGG domain-containing protein [Helianthus debilis subsp. tardiflorus]